MKRLAIFGISACITYRYLLWEMEKEEEEEKEKEKAAAAAAMVVLVVNFGKEERESRIFVSDLASAARRFSAAFTSASSSSHNKSSIMEWNSSNFRRKTLPLPTTERIASSSELTIHHHGPIRASSGLLAARAQARPL